MKNSEFYNRIDAQRKAIKLINSSGVYSTPIYGLSDKAIDRWANDNDLFINDSCVCLIKKISASLFFLSNKSQEQVTDDYKKLSGSVDLMLEELGVKLGG
ncbi:hypothetical protein [Cobetia sp. 1CM21F]|uniref:hypothetical protein n=1 Tax=Cobetia sp. 1CM21F TaxID=2929163 RepID=UPI0020BFEBC6|nr:hypothetical protein [Cobetia sp. 1CM21F]MCK8066413.1 hypothetical protein [Cobetia sp. 1CM21F]